MSLRLKQILLGLLALAVFFDVYAHREISRSKGVYDYTYIYSYIIAMPGDVLLELPSGLTCHNLWGASGPCTATSDGYYAFLHIYHDKWTVNGHGRTIPSSSHKIMRQVDRYFDRKPLLNEIVQGAGISAILIHKYRINEDYKEKYKTFVKSLRPAGKVIFEDQNYVLIAIR
jgi:hypothetical protein